MNLTSLLHSTRARVLALVLLAAVIATAIVLIPTFGAQAFQGGPVDTGWYYVCRWQTEWWDPWNWFNTGATRCGYEWR